MRWVGLWMAGVGCAWGWDTPVDTSSSAGPSTDTDTDTGTAPLPPCPWAGDWEDATHDCEEADTFDVSGAIAPDCVLLFEVVRLYENGTPNPTVCVTTESIQLEYAETGDLWSATSLEQDSSGEDPCYGPFVGVYPLGPVDIAFDGPQTLTITFSRAPWSLSECESATLHLTR